jgi:hypothetical protein
MAKESLARKDILRLLLILGAAVVAVVVILLVANGINRQDDAAQVNTPSPRSEATPTPPEGATTPPADGETAPPAAAPDPSAPPADPGQPAPPPAPDPVTLTEPAAPVPGVTFAVSGLEAVEGAANGPGEVAGPALRFTLSIRNDTPEAVSLASTVVNLFAGPDQAPATDVGEPGGVPLPETVAPGQSAMGVFVFTVPVESRDQVRISVDYSVDAPVVLFEGAAPR